eukprot:TRINITY_DN37840_c0_g1_i1.p1 TRINITY_DN37840_c0_g1~~TRINITY_DN37840_c0_g1_i1.p1  ORF type:complete len:622 (+),score=113.87 TRINITY_DN37840_c0_g1_i1:24-1868(+)
MEDAASPDVLPSHELDIFTWHLSALAAEHERLKATLALLQTAALEHEDQTLEKTLPDTGGAAHLLIDSVATPATVMPRRCAEAYHCAAPVAIEPPSQPLPELPVSPRPSAPRSSAAWGRLSGSSDEPRRNNLRSSAAWGGEIGSSDEKTAVTKKNQRQVFQSADDMKYAIRTQLVSGEKAYNVKDLYKDTGIAQYIAKHPAFENVTMIVIAVYTLWMWVDTDLNDSAALTHAHPVFFAAEQLFCAFFFLELATRFLAFARKASCCRDAWFVFDFFLVLTMVLETWVMAAVVSLMVRSGHDKSMLVNAQVLRIARLMRLTRLFRMARLLRFVPELMIMVKAIGAALRAVTFTLLLLMVGLYVFGIAFKQLLVGTDVASPYFTSVTTSMQTLFLTGTLLDAISDLFGVLEKSEQWTAMVLLYVFIILSAITMMNMLIGVICEVITAVAEAENEETMVTFLRDSLQKAISSADNNEDRLLQQDEFFQMLRDQSAVSALKSIGVDMVSLIDYADIIFSGEEGADNPAENGISFGDFMCFVLDLRNTKTATVKDLVDFRKWLASSFRAELREDMSSLLGAAGVCKEPSEPFGAGATLSSPNFRDVSRSNASHARRGHLE